MVKAATRGHLRPLGKSGHLRPLEWLRVAAIGCFLWDWNTSATRRRRPLAVSCGHSTERPLAATCGHSGKAATCGHSSGCKWLQVAAFYEIETPRPRVEGGHLRSLAATRQSGHLRPLAATRVAASGCKWLLFWNSNTAQNATPMKYSTSIYNFMHRIKITPNKKIHQPKPLRVPLPSNGQNHPLPIHFPSRETSRHPIPIEGTKFQLQQRTANLIQ